MNPVVLLATLTVLVYTVFSFLFLRVLERATDIEIASWLFSIAVLTLSVVIASIIMVFLSVIP